MTESTDDADHHVDHVSQAIINGSASGWDQDSVVVLTTFANGQRAALCSATLVAPNLIMTARHCVSNTDATTACSEDGTPVDGAMISGNRTASSLVVFAGKNGVAPDTTVEANAAAHGAKVIVDASTTVCNHDLAFVMLDQTIDNPVSPMRMGPPAMTETVSAVGWGIDATGNLPSQREVRSGLSLVGIGPALYPDNPSWGYGDAEFMLGESACSGDSGSPAFASTGAIVGVAARAGNGQPKDPNNSASTCMGSDAHAIYTHLDKFQDLITAAFQVAGQPMWLENQPNPWDPTTATTDPTATPAAPGGSGTTTTPNGSATAAKTGSATTNGSGTTVADAPGQEVSQSKAETGGCSSSGGGSKSSGFAAVLFGLALTALRRRRRISLRRRRR